MRGGASAADELSAEVRQVFSQVRNAVVKIEAIDQHGILCGSGFFIDPNGTIYTAYSVGGEAREIVVSFGGKKYPATRLLADPRSGIAILKVDAQTPCLPLGKTGSLGIASPVVAVGYPLDFPVTPNFGMIGGFEVRNHDRFFATAHIRANLPVQRGEGGAPLLNMKGEVLGILISSVDDGSGCFVLPIEAAEKVHSDYMRFGEARPGWVGFGVQNRPLDPVLGSVAEITLLVDGAPAQKGGLRCGDVLVKVGDHPVASFEDMLNASFFLTGGDEVPVSVIRDGQRITVKLQAVDRPGPVNGFAGTEIILPVPSIHLPIPVSDPR